MFGLFKRKEHRKIADKVGAEIHRQLFEAMKADEALASQNLSSAFTVGYLFMFTWFSFTRHGYKGERLADKYIKYICDGVLPGKLYDIFERQMSALEIAKDLGNQVEIELYEKGAEVGVYDSGMFGMFGQEQANNLLNYLTDANLQYEAMPE